METPTPTISKQGVANQKYRNKNRAKYNDYMKEYQRKRAKDPEIAARNKAKYLEYYARKKAKRLAEKLAESATSNDDEEILLQPK